jgi:hypothetical protein
MDHEVVVRQKITERYLLNELDSEARDQFEEHYFDCPTCAIDVRAGSAFVDQTKVVLAETAESEDAHPVKPVPPRPNWLNWLRPAFAAPAMALLLAVVGYQNLVTIPVITKAANTPQVLPWAQLNVGAYGDNEPVIKISPGQGFLLFVRVPHQDGYSSRTIDLYGPGGAIEWSAPLPEASGQGQWPVAVPPSNRKAGTYKLVVRGTNAAGASRELGQELFDLQIQK